MRVLKVLPCAIFLAIVAQAALVNLASPTATDFMSFWHASGLILQGRSVETYGLQPSSVGLLMPLAYPPAFLLFLAPWNLLPFGWSFVLWLAITGGLYLAASKRRWLAFTPPALYNAIIGQNGFLTASIFMFGAKLLKSRPFLSGAIFGLLAIKPHLGVLLPVAFIGGRQWKAFAGAAASSLVLLTLAASVFGIDSYSAWLGVMSNYAGLAEHGRWATKLASVYAIAGWPGQIIAAEFAIVSVWIAWRNDIEGKLPILAAATLLVSPYLFTYDAVILIIPLTYFADRNPKLAIVLWVLMLFPVLRTFGIYEGPNTIPFACVLTVAVCLTESVLEALPYRLRTSRGRLSPARHQS